MKPRQRGCSNALPSRIHFGPNNLGMLYEKGRGVPQDFAKAADLYRQAAPTVMAARRITWPSLTRLGQGVPERNSAGSPCMVYVAETHGDKNSRTFKREVVKKELKPEQLANAEKR